MIDLFFFRQGLAYLSASLGPNDVPLCVQIPRKEWDSLRYQVAQAQHMIREDYMEVRYPAPAGKSWDNGMRLEGAWVEWV